MKKILGLITLLSIQSCASKPSNDDPVQDLIYRTTSHISNFNFEEAHRELNSLSDPKKMLEYHVFKDENGKSYAKVEFPLVSLINFSKSLSEAKSMILEKCQSSIIDEKVKGDLNSLSLEEISSRYSGIENAFKCLQSDSNIRPAMKRLDEMPTNQFESESGTIFGIFKLRNCGEASIRASLPKDVLNCYVNSQLIKSKNILSEIAPIKMQMEKRYQQEQELLKNQQARETETQKNAVSIDSAEGIKQAYCFVYLNFQKYQSMKERVDSGVTYGDGSQDAYDELVSMMVRAKQGMDFEAKRSKTMFNKILTTKDCPKTVLYRQEI